MAALGAEYRWQRQRWTKSLLLTILTVAFLSGDVPVERVAAAAAAMEAAVTEAALDAF